MPPARRNRPRSQVPLRQKKDTGPRRSGRTPKLSEKLKEYLDEQAEDEPQPRKRGRPCRIIEKFKEYIEDKGDAEEPGKKELNILACDLLGEDYKEARVVLNILPSSALQNKTKKVTFKNEPQVALKRVRGTNSGAGNKKGVSVVSSKLVTRRTVLMRSAARSPQAPSETSQPPATKISEPTAKTSEATTKPSQPLTRSSQPATRTSQLATKTSSATKASEATTKTPEPTTKTEPATKTPEPATKTPEPATKTPEPSTKTSEPGTKEDVKPDVEQPSPSVVTEPPRRKRGRPKKNPDAEPRPPAKRPRRSLESSNQKDKEESAEVKPRSRFDPAVMEKLFNFGTKVEEALTLNSKAMNKLAQDSKKAEAIAETINRQLEQADMSDLDKIMNWLEEEEQQRKRHRETVMESLRVTHKTNMVLYSQMLEVLKSVTASV